MAVTDLFETYASWGNISHIHPMNNLHFDGIISAGLGSLFTTNMYNEDASLSRLTDVAPTRVCLLQVY